MIIPCLHRPSGQELSLLCSDHSGVHEGTEKCLALADAVLTRSPITLAGTVVTVLAGDPKDAENMRPCQQGNSRPVTARVGMHNQKGPVSLWARASIQPRGVFCPGSRCCC